MPNKNKDDLFLRSDELPQKKLGPMGLAMASLMSGDDTTPIPVMTFSMPDKTVVFGIRLAEATDSFLVALPAKLYADNNTVIGKELTTAPVIRLMKSSTMFLACGSEENNFFYLRYLNSRAKSFPEYFTEERLEYLKYVTENMPDSAKLALHHIFHGKESTDDGASTEGYDPHEAWKHMPYNKKTIH